MDSHYKITSEYFNSVVKGLRDHYNDFTFHSDGVEPEYQQLMENLLTDITIAWESGNDFVMVEKNVIDGLVEVGAFGEVE